MILFVPKFDYVQKRLFSFLDPNSGNNYQSEKASEAISNGGFFGRGIGEGTLNSRIPEAHTDYIISVISEEFGILIVILIIFAADRLSKMYVIKLIQSQEKEFFIFDFLNITLNWNTGISFGLLSFNANTIYHLISALILLIIIYLIYLMVLSDSFGKLMISFIIGGAAGNLFDRLTYFAVPDFLDFHIKSYHWFTFNIADIFISMGILVIILREFVFEEKT